MPTTKSYQEESDNAFLKIDSTETVRVWSRLTPRREEWRFVHRQGTTIRTSIHTHIHMHTDIFFSLMMHHNIHIMYIISKHTSYIICDFSYVYFYSCFYLLFWFKTSKWHAQVISVMALNTTLTHAEGKVLWRLQGTQPRPGQAPPRSSHFQRDHTGQWSWGHTLLYRAARSPLGHMKHRHCVSVLGEEPLKGMGWGYARLGGWERQKSRASCTAKWSTSGGPERQHRTWTAT